MPDKKISMSLTKNLSEDDAKKLQEQINSNYHLFERLQEVLNDQICEVTKERINRSSFDLPAWAEYQAYLNGKEAALTAFKTLITLRE